MELLDDPAHNIRYRFIWDTLAFVYRRNADSGVHHKPPGELYDINILATGLLVE